MNEDKEKPNNMMEGWANKHSKVPHLLCQKLFKQLAKEDQWLFPLQLFFLEKRE